MPWEEKLVNHHVEDGEDYNKEERRHLDCHSLLHQYLCLFPESTQPTARSKKKEKIQKKRRKSYSKTRRGKS